MGPTYGGTAHGFDNIAYGGGARAPSYEVPPREYMATKGSVGREYGSEPLGDVYPGATLNSASGGPGGYGGGGGFAPTYGGTGPEGYGSGTRGSKYAGGGGRGYGTPTSTLGASSALGKIFTSSSQLPKWTLFLKYFMHTECLHLSVGTQGRKINIWVCCIHSEPLMVLTAFTVSNSENLSRCFKL